MEALYEGWLIKSPPEKQTKRAILKAKWRRRYFVLHDTSAADSYPGVRAVLHYYKNQSKRDLIGSIDLTACETVDSSLRSGVYDNLFSLRTKHKGHDRTYYLAAPTYADMNNWVDCLCQALGLKENNDDKPPEPVSAPVAPTTMIMQQPSSMHQPYTQQQQQQRGPLLSHDTNSSSAGSSTSLQHSTPQSQQRQQQPERPNSRQEGYLFLDECFSDNPPPPLPPSNSSSSALHQVPPAPNARFLSGSNSSHSIPDVAPPPPPKTGEQRNVVLPSQSELSQLYDCPKQSTYHDPKLDYINVNAEEEEDDGTYKVPDSNDNVYKIPPARVGTESLYKVPPVNHLQFVSGQNNPNSTASTASMYSVPPSAMSSALTYEPGLYDVPPNAKSMRDSNSSTDDSGIQSEAAVGRLTGKMKSVNITSDDLYDRPPCADPQRSTGVYDIVPHAANFMHKSRQEIYDLPPCSASAKRLDIYDLPPARRDRDLNDVVPIQSQRKMSEGSIHPPGSNYINIQRSPPPPQQHRSQYIFGSGTVPRSNHPIAPSLPPHPSLDDVYDFPRSTSAGQRIVEGGNNNLDAMPPAPQPHCTGGATSIHRYVNATPAVVHSPATTRVMSQEIYMPMGAGASHEQLNYMPMGPQAKAPGSPLDSYMPMGAGGGGVNGGGRGDEGESGSRASTDSTYTVMAGHTEEHEEYVHVYQQQQQQLNNKRNIPPPLMTKASELGVVKTHRTRSFRRQQDSPQPMELQLPTRKRTVDTESSSDEEDDSDSTGRSDTSFSSRKPPAPGSTSLQSKPPAPLGSTGEVQYLDLDLEIDPIDPPAVFPRAPAISTPTIAARLPKGQPAETDYKEIDFVKTQALTEMRKDLENKRKSSEKSMDE